MPANKEPLCKLGTRYVEQIHDRLIEKLWPGTDPVREDEYRSPELLDSATNRPFQTAFGTDTYPALIEKAAALFHSLISNHPFHNGNKRCAVIAFDHFLLANGFFSVMMNEPMYELAKQTASYRERGISHEDSMIEILRAVGDFVVSLRALEEDSQKNTASLALKQIYAVAVVMRTNIRANPLNVILPPAPDPE
ncbi:MAG: type II toxin-antitoxin system death-on-curing family toxin [Verrucomicrobiota bacterium]